MGSAIRGARRFVPGAFEVSAFGLVAGTPTAVLAAVVMGITYLALGRE
jgi:hypothetical protein